MKLFNKKFRRDEISLKIAILEQLSTPLIKTHIMYQTHINSSRLTELLKELIESDLVIKNNGDKRIKFIKYNGKIVYTRTSKGSAILREYKKITKPLNITYDFL